MTSETTTSVRSSKFFGSIRRLRRKNSATSKESSVSVAPDYPTYQGLDLNALSFLPENSTPRAHDAPPARRCSPPKHGRPSRSSPGGKRSPLAWGASDRPSHGDDGAAPFAKPPTEPPPAYTTAAPRARSPSDPGADHRRANGTQQRTPPPEAATPRSTLQLPDADESPYAFLTTFDTTLLIDDSGSMAGRSWREVSQALMTIAPIVTQHDSDGIDIHFLNHKSADPGDPDEGLAPGGYRGVQHASAVTEIFDRVRPLGGTPTGVRVHAILKPYLAKLEREMAAGRELKPLNLIVLTDGVPSDDVESVLIAAAKKLDKADAPPYQVGVQFFQVGNEPGAKQALMELDDELGSLVEGGIRDIVDTVTWTGGSRDEGVGLTGDGILKVVLGAVVRRLDRRRASGDHGRR